MSKTGLLNSKLAPIVGPMNNTLPLNSAHHLQEPPRLILIPLLESVVDVMELAHAEYLLHSSAKGTLLGPVTFVPITSGRSLQAPATAAAIATGSTNCGGGAAGPCACRILLSTQSSKSGLSVAQSTKPFRL